VKKNRGISVKRYLFVGVLLAMTLLLTACGGESTENGIDVGGTRKTSGVEVISDSGGAVANGVYEVTGEVQNKGKAEASFIKVKASFFDANKQLIDESETSVDIDVLPAGEKAKFIVDSSRGGIADSVASYQLSVSHR